MARPSSSKRTRSSRASSAADRDDREARLRQAASELESGQHSSVRAAAKAHNVPEASLRHRQSGRRSHKDAHADQQTLTPAAESALADHIRRCASSGFPLTPATIREYANTITRPVPGRIDTPAVGKAWLQGFLLRHPSLKSAWSRCLENARLRSTDEEGIRQWFSRLDEIVREFHVSSNNIFNMDESGYRFGQGGSVRVLVPAGDKAARFKAQPGSREMATVIECIGSGGQVLPAVVITKGKIHTVGEQRRMAGIPSSWRFAKTVNGWSNNDLAILWLENTFDACTRPSTPSEYRLLILDGHCSHTNSAFIDACWSRRIIPFLLPPHSTHLLQPLDVSIFGPLTAAYRRIINNVAPHVYADIDKAQFATFYAQAREQTLTQMAARKAFSDSGITVKPSPEKVLARYAGRNTGTPQRTPLQDVSNIPRTNAAVNAMLDDFKAVTAQRDQRLLKRTLLQAFEAPQATTSVLQAENTVLRAQEERRRKMASKVSSKGIGGDQRILSKDRMITREHAERELIAKGPAVTRRQAQVHQQEEGQVLPPPAAADNGDEEEIEDSTLALASSNFPSPPLMRTLLDDLDVGEPLSATEDTEPNPAAFYDSSPQASSSRV